MSPTTRSNVGSVAVALVWHFDGVDKLSPRMRNTARVLHALGAYIFFVPDISIRMQDAAEVLEDISGNLAPARHLEVEYHTLA